MTTGDHVYKKLVTDDDVHNLFGCHKEEYLIDIQCEMTASEGDSGTSQSPDQTGLPKTSKKRRRGKSGGRGGSPQKKKAKVQRTKAPASTPPLAPPTKIKPSSALAPPPKKKMMPQYKGKGKGKGKEQVEPGVEDKPRASSGPPAKASSEAGPAGHNTRLTRSTSKKKNHKTTNSPCSKALDAPLPKSDPHAKKTIAIIGGRSDVEEGVHEEPGEDAEGPWRDENTSMIIEAEGCATLEAPPLEDDKDNDDVGEKEEEEYMEEDE